MPDHPFGLSRRRAMVTGAGRGIGRAAAVALTRAGARVAVNDIDAPAAQETAHAIRAGGGEAWSVPGDVADPGQVEAMVAAAVQALGGLDVLVNNAGIGGRGAPLGEVRLEEWERMLRVNLTSMFLTSKAALPHLLRGQHGCIINVSSVTGMTGWSGSVPYAAAKAGVIGFSKALARELAPVKVRVNVVAPGLIDTRMARERGLDHQRHLVLWPRLGVPEDVAGAIVYLASDAAEYVTGQVLSPNGGALT